MSNDDKMRELLKRICGVERLSDLSYCVVHKHDPKKMNEVVEVIGTNKPQPTGVPVQNMTGFHGLSPFAGTRTDDDKEEEKPAPPPSLPALPAPKVEGPETFPMHKYVIKVA